MTSLQNLWPRGAPLFRPPQIQDKPGREPKFRFASPLVFHLGDDNNILTASEYDVATTDMAVRDLEQQWRDRLDVPISGADLALQLPFPALGDNSQAGHPRPLLPPQPLQPPPHALEAEGLGCIIAQALSFLWFPGQPHRHIPWAGNQEFLAKTA